MKPLAAAIAAMPRSGIREIMDLAWATPGVLRLEAGEPNFPTPDHVVAAAARAAAEGYTKYTPNRGIVEVREAMAAKIAARNGFAVDIDQIVVTTGAVNGLLQALLVVADPGDTVIIPDPGWPNYEMMTSITGTEMVGYPLRRERGYEPDLDALAAACAAPRAKAILLNSPGNPTGAVLRRETIEAVVEMAARHDLYLVSDECYEDIVFEGEHVSPASIDNDGRVITIFSVSKSYAMTGWRIGYAVASQEVAATISKVQEAVTACASAVAQKAAQAALEGDQSCVAEMRNAYRDRRDRVVDILGDAGLLASRPGGAFYVMADTSSTGMGGYEFAKKLIVEHGVAVAPGEAFGPSGRGTIRISLATAMEDLVEGVRRFAAAAQAWS
jgi:aspartate/methionine/tyrosine aminotransferase